MYTIVPFDKTNNVEEAGIVDFEDLSSVLIHVKMSSVYSPSAIRFEVRTDDVDNLSTVAEFVMHDGAISEVKVPVDITTFESSDDKGNGIGCDVIEEEEDQAEKSYADMNTSEIVREFIESGRVFTRKQLIDLISSYKGVPVDVAKNTVGSLLHSIPKKLSKTNVASKGNYQYA